VTPAANRGGAEAGTAPPLDIVYPYRQTPDDAEFRYSLRSLANMEHGRVWIVGDIPQWVRNVEHIPNRNLPRSRFRNALDNVLKACTTEDITDQFILMNDDFFVVQKTGPPAPAHRGPIGAAHRRRPPSRRRRSQQGAPWLQGIWDTAELLKRWGIIDPLSYELHMPLVVERAGMAELLTRALQEGASVNLQQRTLYGNAHHIGGDVTTDVKVAPGAHTLPPGPFVSTNNRSFARGWVGQHIRKRFATPGPYEAT